MILNVYTTSMLLTLNALNSTPVPGEIVGDIRIQFLSPTLVRLEQRGPHGFEDRTTFHVVNRDGPGCDFVREEYEQEIRLITRHGWTVIAPKSAANLEKVRVVDSSGGGLFEGNVRLENSRWLPAPADAPRVWWIADAPRLVPPQWGLTFSAQAKDSSNVLKAAASGWDLANDSPDFYVFLPGGSYSQLRADFLKLTGPIPLPPLFAFGLIDSRYHPYTELTALEQIDTYRAKTIPLDVMVVDTDWRVGASHGYGVNTELFPDMQRFLNEAHARHVKVMFNDHPEPQAQTALDPVELKYRYDGLSGLLKMGVDVWWYDRNWHVGLVEPLPGLRREVWGMKLYHDITQSVFPDRRPMIMANVDGIDNGIRNRPPNMAAHRYPIQWTGDTKARWEYLRLGVENAVYSGVHALNPFTSEDLGGHAGHPETEFYIRFMQFGCLSPIARPHCTREHVRHPWAFGPEAERIVADYVRLRYRLMPLLYASARMAYETGEPVVRRLDLEFPDHQEAGRDDQYLLGENILVAPIVSSPEEFKVVPAELLRTPEGQAGLSAEYFDNEQLEGQPLLTQIDAQLDFNWSTDAVDLKLPTDHFSCRWKGSLGPIPPGPNHRLAITGDDGVRLKIDGRQVVDKWIPQDSATYEAGLLLEPGKSYSIEVEHYEGIGHAVCRLLWRPDIEAEADKRQIWIPPGVWSDAWTGERYEGPREITAKVSLEQIPMYIRGGAVIPLAPDMQYTGEKPWHPMTLEVFMTDTRESRITVYEDDGISNEYINGAFRKTEIAGKVDLAAKSVHLEIGPAVGDFSGAGDRRAWRIRVNLPAVGMSEADFDDSLVHLDPPYDWRTFPSSDRAILPLQNDGPGSDGRVIEITVPAKEVSRGHSISLSLSRVSRPVGTGNDTTWQPGAHSTGY